MTTKRKTLGQRARLYAHGLYNRRVDMDNWSKMFVVMAYKAGYRAAMRDVKKQEAKHG